MAKIGLNVNRFETGLSASVNGAIELSVCGNDMLMFLISVHRFGLLKSQALSDSSKAEHLLAKCTGTYMLTSY